MTQAAGNYGRILYERRVPKETVEETAEAFLKVPELLTVLKSPVVAKSKKHRIIDRVFKPEMRTFLKVVSDHHDMDSMEDIFKAYHDYACEQEGILPATLYYVTKPDESQLEQIKNMLKAQYGKNEVELKLIKDETLIGGFVIRVGCLETDWSMKGRLKQLEQILARR